MQGRRTYTPEPTEEIPRPLPEDCQPGDYWYQPDTKAWMCFVPAKPLEKGLVMGNLIKHEVTEHEDKTISVRPSILVTYGENGENWHGYLEHGIWREV